MANSFLTKCSEIEFKVRTPIYHNGFFFIRLKNHNRKIKYINRKETFNFGFKLLFEKMELVFFYIYI